MSKYIKIITKDSRTTYYENPAKIVLSLVDVVIGGEGYLEFSIYKYVDIFSMEVGYVLGCILEDQLKEIPVNVTCPENQDLISKMGGEFPIQDDSIIDEFEHGGD